MLSQDKIKKTKENEIIKGVGSGFAIGWIAGVPFSLLLALMLFDARIMLIIGTMAVGALLFEITYWAFWETVAVIFEEKIRICQMKKKKFKQY